MIRYTQIETLPRDHPDTIQFMKADKELDDAYASLPDGAFDEGEWDDDPEDYQGDRR